jgi:hypothetical protein
MVGNKKDPGLLLPGLEQFAAVESEEEFTGLIGEAKGMGVGSQSTNYPNSHSIHPQVFLDIKGKRQWEAGKI